MDGAVLSTEEFAFLLGSVGARGLIDVDDPSLFPSTEKKQQKTFEQGLEQLVENGWVETEADDPSTAGLNATLFQLVAIVSAPEFVLSTSVRASEGEPLRLLHYLGNELIVELDAPADSRYQIGVVGSLEQLADRLSQFLGLPETGRSSLVSLAADQAGQLKSQAEAGDLAAAAQGYADSALSEEQAAAFADALASGARADIVGASVAGDEAKEALKGTVFGEGSSAWLAFRGDAGEEQVTFGPANSANLETMISTWLAILE